jgi:aromatic ring-opening dioxygenase LigB subunit
LNGALVPHAPLLLEEISPGDESVRAIRAAIAGIAVSTDAIVVVVTPHGDGSFIYARPWGSLAGFGIDGVAVDLRMAGPEVHDVFARWAHIVEDRLDHGALVPLHLLDVSNPVVAVSVAGDVPGLARSIRDIATHHEVFVICSAHTSARLSERAPLPYSPDAVQLDKRFVAEVEDDCGFARTLAPELASVGGSCSGSTLALFGELFAGSPGSLRAYEAPFGVGYPVVTADRDV